MFADNSIYTPCLKKTCLASKMFTPHHVPNSWRRGDHSGGGVVAKPDRLVALQTLSSERVQQVHLSLSHIQKEMLQ